MSSAYLSPIASSGDSTPPNEEQHLIKPKRKNNNNKNVNSRGELELAKGSLFEEQQESKLINSLKQQQHLQQIDRLRNDFDDQEDDDDDDGRESGEEEEEEEQFDYELNHQRLRLNKQTAAAESRKTSDNNNQQQRQHQHQPPVGHFGLNLKSQLMENCSKTGSQLHHLFQSATCNQLIRTNTNMDNSADNYNNAPKQPNNNNTKQLINGKKLRQLLQSIPLVPIVATSIMTLFIVCIILLSDTLQVATATSSSSSISSGLSSGSSGSPLVGPPSSLRVSHHRRHHNNHHHPVDASQELEAQALVLDRQQSLAPTDELMEKQRREALDGDYPGEFAAIVEPMTDTLPTKSALKRELIEGLLGANQRHRSLPLSSSSITNNNNNHRHSASQLEQVDTLGALEGKSQQQFDSLGAMLMTAGVAGSMEAGAAPAESRGETALGFEEGQPDSGPASVRPAHQRSSPVELVLTEPNSEAATRNSANYEQEVDRQTNNVGHHPPRLTSNNHNLNRHQPHRNQQQQQQPLPQPPPQPADDLQANKNFGHHERPFDVPQIRKYLCLLTGTFSASSGPLDVIV